MVASKLTPPTVIWHHPVEIQSHFLSLISDSPNCHSNILINMPIILSVFMQVSLCVIVYTCVLFPMYCQYVCINNMTCSLQAGPGGIGGNPALAQILASEFNGCCVGTSSGSYN